MKNLPAGMNSSDHRNMVETLRPLAWDSDRLGGCAKECRDYLVDIGIDKDEATEYIVNLVVELGG